MSTRQGAQSAIIHPRKACQRCNLPQSAIRHAQNATSPQVLEPGTARAQERLQNRSQKLEKDAFCA
eukprot:9728210-Alexandrium_andersonii.AAC.1